MIVTASLKGDSVDERRKGGVGLRALMASVIFMGVLIVVGVAFLGLTIARRMSGTTAAPAATLDEPPGTRMVSLSATGERLAVLLQGGGADRLVMIDARSGQVVGRVLLHTGER